VTRIRIEGLTKNYGGTRALSGVDLEIHSGELFFLLGPSGCDKTTLRRTIAEESNAAVGHGLHHPATAVRGAKYGGGTGADS
jgi:ABC-type Fe3+/spermidine/putrescine transport system ATPase subunit